jgi:hypothetical protein
LQRGGFERLAVGQALRVKMAPESLEIIEKKEKKSLTVKSNENNI